MIIFAPAGLRFRPAAGVRVSQKAATAQHGDPTAALGGTPTVTGTGWTTVVALHLDPSAFGTGSATHMLGALPRVSGTWGSGRLLDSRLVSALITDDGRVYVGAVDPSVLYRAAATR